MMTDLVEVTAQVVTLRSALTEALRTAIVSGRFVPGQRLIERELCQMTGAGRASVREALRQLEAEGLVALRPNRGPIVTAITAEDARHLYRVRGALLGLAARLCAEARPPQALEAVAEATAALEEAAAAGHQRRIVAAGDRFLHALAEGSGNPVLQQMLLSLHNRLALMRNLSMARPRRVREGLAAYRAIRDAIRAGDAAQAEALCVRHSEAGAAMALEILAKAGVETMREAKAV